LVLATEGNNEDIFSSLFYVENKTIAEIAGSIACVIIVGKKSCFEMY
jgi:hypothetical protein